MADNRDASGAHLSPDDVVAHAFPTSFRGYDPAEVRAFLVDVASALRELERRQAALEGQLARERAREVKPVLDEATLTVVLGEEAARLLRSAQEAAHDIRAKAEDNAQRMLREAHEEAARLRTSAETILSERSAEAEDAAGLILAEAEARAKAFGERASAEAEVELERARSEGRSMVEEAHAHREKVLGDLARRKRTLQAQLEVLRGGRDHLVDRVREVRATLDELAERLARPEPDVPEPVPQVSESEVVPDLTTARETSMPSPSPSPSPPREPAHPAPPAAAAAAPAARAPSSPAPTDPSPAATGANQDSARERRTPAAAKATLPVVPNGTTPAEDERVSSSLRILRKSAEAPDAPAAPATEPPARPGLTPVERRDDSEGVRIIGPARSAVEPAAEPEPQPVNEPEPEPVVEPEAPPAQEAIGDAPTASEAEAPDSEPENALEWAMSRPPPPAPIERPSTPRSEAPAKSDTSAVGAPTQPEVHTPAVDELFARIRADRAAALAADAPDVGAEAEDARPEPPRAPEQAAGVGGVAVAAAAGDELVPGTDEAPVSNDDEVSLQRRDAEIEALEAQLLRKMKRALQDEQNDVLDRVRTVRGKPTAVAVLPSSEDHLGRYREVALPFLRDLSVAGSGGATVEVADLAGQMAAELAEPLLDRLRRALSDVDDLDAASAGDRLSSAYREWKGERIERVVSYYVIAAHARGALVAQPDGATLRWIVDDEGGPCPDCDDNSLAGPTPKGDPFPTGQLHPPAHAGCRCLLAPAPA